MLPKILCLHGTGSSGAIFKAQTRKLCRELGNEFEFVFPDAPHPSQAGPGMYEVYHMSGPFFRWHIDAAMAKDWDVTENEAAAEREAVRELLKRCLLDQAPGAAPFVGIMAFSQGARVMTDLLVSLLNSQHWQLPELQFAILCCGTYPPLMIRNDDAVVSDRVWEEEVTAAVKGSKRLHINSLHLHGTRDPYRLESERLLNEWYDTSTSRIITFSGGHQPPAKDSDVKEVAEAVRKIYQGILRRRGLIVSREVSSV